MNTIRLTINVPEGHEQDWVGIAYKFGYKRVDPRKKWSPSEIKEATRFAMTEVIDREFATYQQRSDR